MKWACGWVSSPPVRREPRAPETRCARSCPASSIGWTAWTAGHQETRSGQRGQSVPCDTAADAKEYPANGDSMRGDLQKTLKGWRVRILTAGTLECRPVHYSVLALVAARPGRSRSFHQLRFGPTTPEVPLFQGPSFGIFGKTSQCLSVAFLLFPIRFCI